MQPAFPDCVMPSNCECAERGYPREGHTKCLRPAVEKLAKEFGMDIGPRGLHNAIPTQRERLIPPMISIRNDGPILVETNYWATENAARGLYYLTTNAGCMRLLVPQSLAHPARMEPMIRDVREVVLTRGRFEGQDNTVEVMFEDDSLSPFCILIDPKQVDRRWTPKDEGKRCAFAIYTELGKFAEFSRCFLRSAAMLPYAHPYSRER